MRILALDTATENCSAALLTGAGVSAREERPTRGHAGRILAMVAEVLDEAGLSLAQLTALAFGRGPGAFTGVRLAASICQGLAFGANRPVVPVSDLRALAQRVLTAAPEARAVLVCNDARMQEVYWGAFERGPDGLARAVQDEAVGAAATVSLPTAWKAGVHGAGSGFVAYPELKVKLTGLGGRVWGELLPSAREIAQLAAAEVLAGRQLRADEAVPVYLRDDVARPPP
jgi:tRNA threonylcarbamoyladenosine biosynthesis protein TsaB